MTMHTNAIQGAELRELKSDELDAVTGGFSFSVGFMDVRVWGKDDYGRGLGPAGDGTKEPMSMEVRLGGHRIQMF